MWLLSCDGDLLGGKRIWLRPGTTHLLGRTSGLSEGGERIQYIDTKSVSRKHLLIEVSSVRPGDDARLFTRSEIKATDGSKLGTLLNGQRILKETKTLDAKEYEIKLGSYEHLFHLAWHPVTFCLSSGSKKVKDEALSGRRREVLEHADIKLVDEYVTNETTHAIAKKRNNPTALQALIQGRWLVTSAFIEAVYHAVNTTNPQEPAPLEQDFDGKWPSEEDYFVPASSEPTPRPDSYLKPDANRLEVFHNYTFVFLVQSQYDSLLPVITSGGGKALLREVEVGTTPLSDVVSFVKEVDGRKHDARGRASPPAENGGAVVVRMNERDEEGRKFMRSIDVALNLRSIEQGEFLDAILTVNASSLRRELEEAEDGADEDVDVVEPQAPVSDGLQQKSQQHGSPPQVPNGRDDDQEMEDEPVNKAENSPQLPAAKRRNRRIITQSRFKGFDDFDPSQFAKAASGSPEPTPSEQAASQAAGMQNMDVDDPFQSAPAQQQSRKRARAEQQAKDEEDMYATILPSHAAMKRRKLEAEQNSRSPVPARSSAVSPSPQPRTTKGKKKQKELDVKAEIQKRVQAQEEERRQNEESLRRAMEGVDIAELKNLAQIEEIEVPERRAPGPRQNGEGDAQRSAEWKPEWNGRKNFKNFRPQGRQSDAPQLRRVIVPLQEVPRKGHGMGDEYWLTSSSATTGRSSNKSKSQSQSQSTRRSGSRANIQNDTNDGAAGGDDEHEDEATRFRRRIQRSREEDAENAIDEEIRSEHVAGGRARDESIQNTINSTPSQTLGTASQRKAAGKRPAAAQAGGPAKRMKQGTLAPPGRSAAIPDDEDDDDGLKFRRRR